MKHLGVLSLLILGSLVGCGQPIGQSNNFKAESEQDYGPGFFDKKIDTTAEDEEGGETNGDLPSPEELEETLHLKGTVAPLLTFAQTKWTECDDVLTGQYLDFNCTNKRNISVILDSFLEKRLMSCVDRGIAAQSGGGTTADLHIVHAGITGDIRHSPKSLHSYNRAIDIKVLRATLTTGEVRTYTYAKTGNRTFYTELRKCWGDTVHTYNGCPYYGGDSMLTGSIGWENSNHGHHMHLSVPYCLSGRYGSGVWVR